MSERQVQLALTLSERERNKLKVIAAAEHCKMDEAFILVVNAYMEQRGITIPEEPVQTDSK